MEIVERAKCCGCTACYSSCPTNAIKMSDDKEGFKYPIINETACIRCNKCKAVCPVLHIDSLNNPYGKTYAAVNRDIDIRLESSSGGIFDSIAKSVLQSNGVVYGVALDEHFDAFVFGIDDVLDLKRIRGSKYLQAEIGEAYRNLKSDLLCGRTVLFVGTPCQVAGLRRYLGKEYENLILVDLICHGVPSAKLFKQYLSCLEEKYRSTIKSINFRSKKYGWNNYGLRIQFANNKKYNKPNQADPWMLSFNANVMLRKSCYGCQFRSKGRVSDLTLGDLWGVDIVAPELNDNRGVSLVIEQSPKGVDIIKRIKEDIICKEIDFDLVRERNSFYSFPVPDNRSDFINIAMHDSFMSAYKRYVAKPYIMTLIYETRLLLSNFKQRLLRR